MRFDANKKHLTPWYRRPCMGLKHMDKIRVVGAEGFVPSSIYYRDDEGKIRRWPKDPS